jgi:hypothetical protein
MISFKQFINEEKVLPRNVQKSWAEKAATEEQAIAWLIANNKEALASGKLIYRGFGDPLEADYTFLDSTNAHRSSRDSSGLYQMMMDASEAFKGFPSRSNSYICTTTDYDARRYGVTFAMFPKKGAKLAISENGDFFESRTSGEAMACFGMSDIQDFNSSVSRRLKDGFGISSWDFKGKSTADVDKILAVFSVEEFMKEMGLADKKPAPQILAQIQKQGGKGYFTALANIVATPFNFGVEMAKYGTAKLDEKNELWFSGKVLVVDQDKLADLLQKLPPEIKVAHSIK